MLWNITHPLCGCYIPSPTLKMSLTIPLSRNKSLHQEPVQYLLRGWCRYFKFDSKLFSNLCMNFLFFRCARCATSRPKRSTTAFLKQTNHRPKNGVDIAILFHFLEIRATTLEITKISKKKKNPYLRMSLVHCAAGSSPLAPLK